MGPLETIVVLSPLPPFHVFLIAWTIPSSALVTPEPSPEGTNRARTFGSFALGRPSTPPSPSSPWISGSCFAGRISGFVAPGKTLMCDGAPYACKHRAALRDVWVLGALPWVYMVYDQWNHSCEVRPRKDLQLKHQVD